MLAVIASLALLFGSLIASDRGPAGAHRQVGSDQLPQGARVLATANAGPDASGTMETVVAYFVRDTSFPNLEIGQMGAVAIRASAQGSQTYKLGDNLGEAPYAEVVARDLNGDGATELAVFGAAGAHSTMLRIFTWNGSGYRLIDEFFGDSGIGLTDVDGDGVDELIVGTRHYDRAQLRDDVTLRWNGSAYAPAYSRWSFTFDDPSFRDYPEAAVLSYYLAIADHDYQTAYDLLGPGMRSGLSYAAFVQGFADTLDVRVEDLEVFKDAPESANVRVALSSLQRDGSEQHFGGTWIVERAGGAWRLAGAYLTPL